MVNYHGLKKYFNQLNISEEEGEILLNYFKALAYIAIEHYNNKQVNKFEDE